MLFDEGDDKMVKTEAFPTIRMKIDRLLKITNEYQFNDLVKAVYCINLCINNRSVLEYVSGTIDYFIEENKNDGVVEKRFVLPTEILFYKVQKFFKEEVKKYDILELDSLMMSEGTTIEKSHFVCREDNIYPLYNVSLLIDLYDIWENKIDFKEQISVANEGIIDRIYMKCV